MDFCINWFLNVFLIFSLVTIKDSLLKPILNKKKIIFYGTRHVNIQVQGGKKSEFLDLITGWQQ